MKIKVLKRSNQELKLEVEEEGHTLFNLLEKVLIEDDAVEIAGYNIPHPLTSNLILYIRSKEGRNPEDALKDALTKILETCRELKKTFKEALQDWNKTSECSQ